MKPNNDYTENTPQQVTKSWSTFAKLKEVKTTVVI